MIFLQLFLTFLLIGALTFGGGYSMIALIQGEVVTHWGWISADEFTDLLAISQITPGPVGINTATYAGYTAVLNAGYPAWAAVGGSLLASLAVVLVPVSLVMIVGHWMLNHKSQSQVAAILRIVRLVVIGLIAAAALQLIGPESFGSLGLNKRFIISVVIFAAVFLLSWRRKASPILLIFASGLVGLIVYSV